MGLTYGDDPFGPRPAGRLSFQAPEEVSYTRPLGRRVRAVVDGAEKIDSDDVHLVWVTGKLPHYAFPAADVEVASEPEPVLEGYVTVPWGAADAWYEEDERVFVHPRDPFHRIDTFQTSRRIRALAQGSVLAESTRTKALFETGLPVRYYFPSADVRLERLSESPTVTECPYKGTASYHSMTIGGEEVDVAWTYSGELQREGEPIRDLIAFLDDHVEIQVLS